DERLIAQEAANAPPIDISVPELDAAVERLQSRFPSPAAFAEALHEHGLNPAELRRQLRQKIQVLKFADHRFRPFIIVPTDEIQTYYETELRAELQKRHVAKIPDVADVRETIQAILVERKLNQELERWIQELRERAVIRVLVQPE